MNLRDSYAIVKWDISKKNLDVRTWGKQNDTGRGLRLTLIQNSIEITPSNETIRFYCEKKDGTRVYIDATTEGKEFIVDFTNQVFAVKGNALGELQLSVDGKWVASETFKIPVDESLVDGSIVSTDDFQALQNALNSVDNLEEQYAPRLNTVETHLAENASQNEVDLLSINKADKTQVDSLAISKADKTYVDTKAQGASLVYKESYPTFEDLEVAYPIGDIYNHVVLADGMVYTYVGGAWVNTQIQANGTGIANSTITTEKTTFAETLTNKTIYGYFEPVNILSQNDYLPSTIGHYLDPDTNTDGSSQYTSGYIYTNYVRVYPNINYVRRDSYSILFYDSNQVFISGTNGGTYTAEVVDGLDGYAFTTPGNCHFIRMNGSKNTYGTEWMYQMEVPVEQRAVEIKNLSILGDIEKLQEKASLATVLNNTTVDGLVYPLDIFDVNDYLLSTTGYYLDYITGVASSTQYTTTYIYTGFISVIPNIKYARKNPNAIVFYDINQNFIGGLSLDGIPTTVSAVNGQDAKVFTIPSNAHFMRMNGHKNYKSDDFLYQMEIPSKDKAVEVVNLKLANASKVKGKKIVCFGDSIFGNFHAPSDIPTYIANLTDAEVINVGFGGCRMGTHPSVEYDAFSMYRLGYSIATRDFALQDTHVADPDVPTYFTDHLATLKAIDFNTVDIVTISFGTNDWGANSPIDKTDLLDPTSFRGALRYSLSQMLTAYKHLKVLVLTPIYRFDFGYEEGKDSDTFVMYSGDKMVEYVTAILEMGKEFKMPTVDMYHECGINKYNRNYYFNSAIDKVHPNEKGRKRMAEKIVGELERNF